MSNSKIFFSYAWGDAREQGESREKIVNELYESLKKDGYEVVRDKVDLGYKGFITEFMKQIGESSRIIVVVSDKYVRSPYCMFELYEIARNCKFDKKIFRERVFPIMAEFIDFARPKVLGEYLQYWEEQKKEWEELFNLRIKQLSTEQYARYDKVKLIGENISKLLDWLADMNTLNPMMLSENNFAEIKKALGQIPAPDNISENIPDKKTEEKPNKKKELLDLIDDGEYAAFLEAVKNSNCEYNKPTLSLFRNQIIGNAHAQDPIGFAQRLRAFVGTMKCED